MNKHLIYLTSILNAGILFFGCFAGLNQYQPRSVEEEAVIKVVMEHERTWNENDVSGFLATYHENARIEIGCGGQLLSKNDLGAALLRRPLLTVSGSLYCFILDKIPYLITFR